MSKTSIVALLLALGLVSGGCKSAGDDDDTGGDDTDEDDDVTEDDDATTDDDDDDDLADDDQVGDDDDSDCWNQLDSFEPSSIVVGETPSFVATGDFCEGTEIYFTIPGNPDWVFVEEYSHVDKGRIEGVMPAGLWVGVFHVMASCWYCGAGGIADGLEVLSEESGDDDSS